MQFWVLALRSFKLWSSLLVLGFSFWLGGKLVTLRVLNHSYQTPRYFIADVESEETTGREIASIKVKIYERSGISIAEVFSNDLNAPERELQFDLTAPQDIEQELAQALRMPLSEVRGLIYYKVRKR